MVSVNLLLFFSLSGFLLHPGAVNCGCLLKELAPNSAWNWLGNVRGVVEAQDIDWRGCGEEKENGKGKERKRKEKGKGKL